MDSQDDAQPWRDEGLAEWLGFAVAFGAMWFTRNDFISSIGAVASVALVRLYNV